MRLIELQNESRTEYNNFVATKAGGSFLQSWEWGTWQERLGRNVYRFKVQGAGSEWEGALQVIEIPVLAGKSYLYVPYGPVFKSAPDGDAAGALLSQLRGRFPTALFLRLEPKQEIGSLSLVGRKTVNIQPARTLVVDIGKLDEELLSEMHHKTRYNIKVAQKHGVRIASDAAEWPDEALELLVETSGRHGFHGYPKGYYGQLVEFFGTARAGEVSVRLYRAEHAGQLLASALMVDFGNTRTYLFGGSSRERKQVMAPYLLHWQAMQDARQAGMSRYDFWGIETSSGEAPGFVRFKLGFGGAEVRYPGACDVVFRPAQYRLYGIMRAVNRALRLKK